MPGRKEANYGTLPEGLNPLIPQTQKSEEIQLIEPKYPLETKVVSEKTDALHLMIVSNVMYGSKFCDVETFEKHMQIAESLDNTKVIFLGNLISNQPGRNVHTDVKTPWEQIYYIGDWIDRLDAQNKVLAAVRADYPKASVRSEEKVDDINDIIFEDSSFPVLQNGGILEVSLGNKAKDTKYKLALYSKNGSSRAAMTKSESAKKAFLTKIAGNADIAIVANPYIADVTQTVVGNPPTRQELTLVTAGGYIGNISGERPDLTDQVIRDKYGIDGQSSGQVITLFSAQKDTKVYLKPEHFVFDNFVDSLTTKLDNIKDAGKEADFYRSLTRRGVKLSEEDKQVIFQSQNAINKLLAEQKHPQRRRD